MTIREKLLSTGDTKYKAFCKKLNPTVNEETIIGIQIPKLKKLAKELKNSDEAESFLSTLPHRYFEENNLHALLISEDKNFERVVARLNAFLPYIDNWATCDILRPKAFSQNKEALIKEIYRWLADDWEFTQRFAIEMLMVHFLKEAFNPEYATAVASVKSQEYYVNMMIAWYFATALAKNRDEVLPFITEYRLTPFVHNKTIQKACESFRIDKGLKELLKSYRISRTEVK